MHITAKEKGKTKINGITNTSTHNKPMEKININNHAEIYPKVKHMLDKETRDMYELHDKHNDWQFYDDPVVKDGLDTLFELINLEVEYYEEDHAPKDDKPKDEPKPAPKPTDDPKPTSNGNDTLYTAPGVRVFVADGYVRIANDEKPSAEIRDDFKALHFRWNVKAKAWQLKDTEANRNTAVSVA